MPRRSLDRSSGSQLAVWPTEPFENRAEILLALAGIVPEPLIEAVLRPSCGKATVGWDKASEDGSTIRLVAVEDRRIESSAAYQSTRDQAPRTAPEAMAMLLTLRTRKLRAERSSPRRVNIAAAACLLLKEEGATPYVFDLIVTLLDQDRARLKGSKRPEAREAAAWALAGDPKVDVDALELYPKKDANALATAVGVHRTSLGTWMRDPVFKNDVEDKRRKIEWVSSDTGREFARRLPGLLDGIFEDD
jgi:hypothetical protein